MVNLKEFVQNNGGLDYVVEENGQNVRTFGMFANNPK